MQPGIWLGRNSSFHLGTPPNRTRQAINASWKTIAHPANCKLHNVQAVPQITLLSHARKCNSCMNANPRIVHKPNSVTANPNVKLQSVQIRMMFRATLQSCAPTTNPASNEKSCTRFPSSRKFQWLSKLRRRMNDCLQVGSPFGLRYHASGSGLFSSTKAWTIWSCHSHATMVKKTCYTSHHDLCCVLHEC